MTRKPVCHVSACNGLLNIFHSGSRPAGILQNTYRHGNSFDFPDGDNGTVLSGDTINDQIIRILIGTKQKRAGVIQQEKIGRAHV